MATLHISELAERSSVPVSTLRYYERIGLVSPADRAPNGYRIYDDDALDRLAFIGRAKRLGMSLDEVAALIEVWVSGDCGPVQDQLRAFVNARLAELHRHMTEDTDFESQLRRILDQLDAAPRSAGGPCGPNCGCDTDAVATSDGVAVACTLTPDALDARLEDWRQVVGAASRVERDGRRMIAEFVPSPALVGEVAALCAAETACCPSFTFTLGISATRIRLVVDGDPDTLEVLVSIRRDGDAATQLTNNAQAG